MRKVLYHPILKFFGLLLFLVSVDCTAYFVCESLSVLSPWIDSITRYLFHWILPAPTVFALTIGAAVLTVLLLSFLVAVAGRSYRDGEVRLTPFNKIPFDLYLTGAAGLVIALFALTDQLARQSNDWEFLLYLGMIFVPACAFLFAMTVMSFAARVRAGTWWHNNLITYSILLVWRVLTLIWKVLCHICRFLWTWFKRSAAAVWHFITALPTIPLTVGFVVSVCVLVLISIAARSTLLFILTGTYAIFFILLGAIYTRRLERGAKRLAQGDLESHIGTGRMFGVYRKHAEHLNHIRDGMSEAVEAQLRSERMKTELITNVSHDIKTPLTSIINYVDLMKKEPIESETVKEYLEIMDRQSTRLKKLIEDLIEVSKASTGNVTTELELTDVNVLLEQALGEYRERMTAADLTLCVTNRAQGAQIMADGKLIWRVFDNLLGNVCKYSMPGTRVYLNAEVREDTLEISLRNISLYSLNITSEELMERFVRGDRSRHTEGSGLGLSIAKNLVELQKGKLEIVIDGDLFKAILTFPMANK